MQQGEMSLRFVTVNQEQNSIENIVSQKEDVVRHKFYEIKTVCDGNKNEWFICH